MKTLPLKLDLKGIKLADEEVKLGPVGMSLRIINNVINVYGDRQVAGKHYRGFNKPDRRILYELMAKFRIAKETKCEALELEDKEAAFIQRCFTAEFMPNEVVSLVEANVDGMK